MNLNYNGFEYIQCATTARQVSELSRQKEEALRAAERERKERAKREERMAAGAEASIAQIGILEKQVEFIQEQNEILSDNYLKLKKMYEDQVETNKEAKEEQKRNKRINIIMMIIAIIAMLAAIAGPIVTILVGK